MQQHLNQLLVRSSIAFLLLCIGGRSSSQTFKTLFNFGGGSHSAVLPTAGVILSGNSLYGATYQGGAYNSGTVFKANINGSNFTVIHDFTSPTSDGYTNNDGAAPTSLILFSNVLYGTTRFAGASGNGTIFKLNTDGMGFTTLHSFSSVSTSPPYANFDGASPEAKLTLSGDTLYGTTHFGGAAGNGVVFKLNTDGTGFATLHNFSERSPIPPYANSDGAFPLAPLAVSNTFLYGTTYFGGEGGNGAVFRVDTNGTSFSTLHSFGMSTFPSLSNLDGALPQAGLILSGNALYGTTSQGGSGHDGTLFKICTDGTGFKVLHTFSPSYNSNADGANPAAQLNLYGNTLYGTTYQGGTAGSGSIFKLNTDGTGFVSLYSFTRVSLVESTNYDGALPGAGVTLSSNVLYGTANWGGAKGGGTIFTLSLAPNLSVVRFPGNSYIRLSWSTNDTGYRLQASPTLVSSVWTNLYEAPIISRGQNVVTLPVTGPNLFYRLFGISP